MSGLLGTSWKLNSGFCRELGKVGGEGLWGCFVFNSDTSTGMQLSQNSGLVVLLGNERGMQGNPQT